MLRKVMLYTLVATVVTSTAVTIQAQQQDEVIYTGDSITDISLTVEPFTSTRGLVTQGEFTDIAGGRLHVLSEDGLFEIAVNIVDYKIFDMVTGELVGKESIIEGEEVIVYHSIDSTMSIPPQAMGIAYVFVNVSDENSEIRMMEILEQRQAQQNEQLPFIRGIVGEITDNRIQVLGNENPQNVHNEIVLDISNARIHSMVSGRVFEVDFIREGQEVLVYHSPNMTRSMPPQAAATHVFVNAADENAATRKMILGQKMEGSSDNEVFFMSSDGSYIIRFNQDTEITNSNGDVLSIELLNSGSGLLVWYPFMAMSMPGQATATKAVILDFNTTLPINERSEDETNLNNDEESLDYVGYHSDLEVYIMSIEDNGLIYTTENGIAMVPVRKAAELNGFTVSFNTETKLVEVSKNGSIISFRNGDLTYTYNGEIRSFNSADTTQLIDGVSHIKMDFLMSLIAPNS